MQQDEIQKVISESRELKKFAKFTFSEESERKELVGRILTRVHTSGECSLVDEKGECHLFKEFEVLKAELLK